MASGIEEARKQAAAFKKVMAAAEGHMKDLSALVSDAMKDYGTWSAEAADIVTSISMAKGGIDDTVGDLKMWIGEAKNIKGDAETVLAKWAEDEKALEELRENLQSAEKALSKDKTNKDLKQKYLLAEKACQMAEVRTAKASTEAQRILTLAYKFGPSIEETKKIMTDLTDQLKSGLSSLAQAKKDGRKIRNFK